jgi:hypothetical protein
MSLIKHVKHNGKKKMYGVEFTENVNNDSVARFLSLTGDEVVGFATMLEKSKNQKINVDSDLYDVEPLIPMKKHGFTILITGESDTGKTTLGAMYLNQYRGIYPNRPMFLVSVKRKEADQNLSNITELEQMTNEEIMNFDLNDYSNCIFLVDDADFGKVSKAVFELLNQVSTVGREQGVSLIFISHFNSRLTQSKVYTEFKVYCTFLNNLINNRALEVHMGFSKKQLQEFIDLGASYYCFNRDYRVLVTDKQIIKY